MDKVFPVNVNDWESKSVSKKVGSVNEPPPLESVIIFPVCVIVCGT